MERLIRFGLLTVTVYFALQSVVVVLHEYAHSTAAWLLGYTQTPFTVVWGNPITIQGWDEGVPYDQLFPSTGHAAEAVIGGVPLLMHLLFAALALALVWRPATKHKFGLYALYLFLVVNCTELVAYIFMRPLAGSGDTGRFNQGLNLSPWPLFLGGSAVLLVLLGLLSRKVMPSLDRVLGWTKGQQKTVVWFTAFILFLWGSGLRIMALFPDRQWRWGLLGLAGFFLWPFLVPEGRLSDTGESAHHP